MVWHSIIQHFLHFDGYLTEGVYQHGCHLTGHSAPSESNQQFQGQPLAEQTRKDGVVLIFGYMAARRPASRAAFR